MIERDKKEIVIEDAIGRAIANDYQKARLLVRIATAYLAGTLPAELAQLIDEWRGQP